MAKSGQNIQDRVLPSGKKKSGPVVSDCARQVLSLVCTYQVQSAQIASGTDQEGASRVQRRVNAAVP